MMVVAVVVKGVCSGGGDSGHGDDDLLEPGLVWSYEQPDRYNLREILA